MGDEKRFDGFSNEAVGSLVFDLVEMAMEKKDRGVSISFTSDSTYVNVYPMGDDEEAIPLKWLVERQSVAERTDGEEALKIAKAIFLVASLWEKEK